MAQNRQTTWSEVLGWLVAMLIALVIAIIPSCMQPNYDRVFDKHNKELEAEGRPPLTKEQKDAIIKQATGR